MRTLAFEYDVTTYARMATEPELERASGDVVGKLVLTDYDHILWPSRDLYGFRRDDGEWIEEPIRGSGLGKVCWDIIRSVQLNPGDFLTPGEIALLTGNENLLDANNLSARVMAIRRAHEDPTDQPRFFQTLRRGGYGLMWPVERSWLWIDRVPLSLVGAAGKDCVNEVSSRCMTSQGASA